MGLIKLFRYFSLSVLMFTIIGGSVLNSITIYDLDSHLEMYSDFNSYEHDNIDEQYHSHSHKHSEDGEEHEHDHIHSNLNHYEYKHILSFSLLNSNLRVSESKLGRIERNLFSNAHPLKIYRPPINIRV